MKKKYRLRTWFKALLWTILIIAVVVFNLIAIHQLNTIETIKVTPAGDYVCKGKWIPVCNGSDAVYKYLGI